MWDEENFFETLEAILADDRIPAFQRLHLWEDLRRLEAAWVGMKVETNAPSSRLSLVGRIKSILTANPAYYSFRRGAREAVHKMRIFRSNLGDMRSARLARGVFEQLLWYWQLEPEKEINNAPCTLEMRLFVQQTRRRLMRYKDAVIGFTVGSVALLVADKPLVEYVYLRVQSGVSPLEVILFHLGVFLFSVSSLFLALGLYYYALYILHALHMLTQFQPPDRGAG